MSDEQWAHIMNLVHSYSPFHTLTEWYIQQMKNITSWLDAHVFILHTNRVLNYNFLIRLVGTWTKKVDPDSDADILEFRLCPSNGWCISLERSRFSLKTYTYLFIYLFVYLFACMCVNGGEGTNSRSGWEYKHRTGVITTINFCAQIKKTRFWNKRRYLL